MFKVLIIDDEPIIRKGLKNIINWKQYDCEVCGEAADGVEGGELIKQLLPDIIFTDIRMPEVDGLTMLREIKDLVPWSKIVILTGYRDFDYAQEAIKLGAFDFILKPSKIEELMTVVKKAVKELKFQREKSEEIDKLKILFEQNLPVLREKLLYDIIYSMNTNESEILSKMQLFKIQIDSFIFLIVENENDDEGIKELDQYDKHLYQFGIMNTFEEVFSEVFKIISISLSNKRIAFIIQPKGDNLDFANEINIKCAYVQEIIQNCFGFTVTIAVSSKGEGAYKLPEKLKECLDVLEHKFYLGNNSIIFYKDMDAFFKFEDYSLLEEYRKQLLEGIKAGNEKMVKEKLQEIFNYIDTFTSISKDYLRNFYWNTITLINNIRVSVSEADNEKDAKKRDITSLFKLIEKSVSLKELNSVIEEVAITVTARVNSFNKRSLKLILRKAIEYLNSHYNEAVTLNEVAEHAYVSTFYISRMFKKELGKNFVDYLNEIRVDKAKELLKNIRFKTYEVAELVGIPDAHYFSKIFRKHTGITPTEYRESLDI